MSDQPESPGERYAAIVDALAADSTDPPSEPTGRRSFGSSGQLTVGGKIFAMLVRDRLVVKLPRERVDALVAAGDGERFDPRRDGRLMKEWLVLDPASEQDWLSLGREAREFVGSHRYE